MPPRGKQAIRTAYLGWPIPFWATTTDSAPAAPEEQVSFDRNLIATAGARIAPAFRDSKKGEGVRFRKLGNLLVTAGCIGLIVGGFFYGRVNNERFRQQELEAIVKRSQRTPSGFTDGAYLGQIRERTEDRAIAFLSAGGLLVVFGTALKLAGRRQCSRSSTPNAA
jgi:hypothetical protein